MKKVKAKIAQNLFDALYEANMSDATDGDAVNDLEPVNSSKDNLYGSLGNAIKDLGYYTEYVEFLETGDRVEIKSE